jgi:hypothetical protein
MAHPRTPLAKAKATGQTYKNAKRFKQRSEPASRPLGKPSPWLTEREQEVWEAFKREVTWLTEADRSTVENACTLRARIWDGERGEKIIGRLQSCLARMGATPADRTKVHVPKEDDQDPADEFLQ